MPITIRREPLACPICGLKLTVLRANDGAGDGAADGPTLEYDVAEWARLCSHAENGSPIVCPSLQPLLKDWLRRP